MRGRKVVYAILMMGIILFSFGLYHFFAQSGDADLNGEKHVRALGNRVVDENGTYVTLRGVSIADPYYLSRFDGKFSEVLFAELSEWNINTVRIPIHPGWWLIKPNYMEAYLDKVMTWSHKYGYYVILDWHAIGNPFTGVPQNPEWVSGGNAVYNSSWNLVKSAWMDLAGRYGSNPKVIFELFNEPAPVDEGEMDWLTWKTMIEGLIDDIRGIAPNTLILVSGWLWTHNLRGFDSYPIERENIGYVAHIYPDSGNESDWEYHFGFLAERHPIFVTEWGFSPNVSSDVHYFGTREEFGRRCLIYMEEKGFNWMAWCFHPEWGPNMIMDWEYSPSPEGLLVKQALVNDSLNPAVTTTFPENSSVVTGMIECAGTALDDTGLLSVSISINDGLYHGVDNVFSMSYKVSNWSYRIDTNTLTNGIHTISVKVIDTSLNAIEVNLIIEVRN